MAIINCDIIRRHLKSVQQIQTPHLPPDSWPKAPAKMLDDHNPKMDNTSKRSVWWIDQVGTQGKGEEANGELSDAEEVIVNGGGEDEAEASQGEEL